MPTPRTIVLLALPLLGSSRTTAQTVSAVGGPAPEVSAAVSRAWTATTGGVDVQRVEDLALRVGGRGYDLAGTSFPPAAASDGWLVRVTPGGRTRWSLTVGGPGQDELRAVEALPDGGLIAAGSTRSFGSGGSDGWLVRLDAAGRIVWQKAFGEAGDEAFLRLAPSQQGFFVGGTRQGGRSGLDLWLLHVDPDGQVLWQASYGGSLEDDLTSVRAVDDGLVVLSKSRSGLGGASVAVFRPWMLRLDGQGNPLWQKTYDFSGGDAWYDVAPLADGGYVVTGEILETGFQGGDAWVVRLDALGNVVWDRRLGDSLGVLDADTGDRVLARPEGGFVVLGSTATAGAGSRDVWELRLDEDGVLVENRTLGGAGYEEGIDLVRTESTGFLAAAFAPGFAGAPGNALLLRLDAAGASAAGCDLEHVAAPRIWTDTLVVTEPLVVPVPTAAPGVDTQAVARPLPETGGLLCR